MKVKQSYMDLYSRQESVAKPAIAAGLFCFNGVPVDRSLDRKQLVSGIYDAFAASSQQPEQELKRKTEPMYKQHIAARSMDNSSPKKRHNVVTNFILAKPYNENTDTLRRSGKMELDMSSAEATREYTRRMFNQDYYKSGPQLSKKDRRMKEDTSTSTSTFLDHFPSSSSNVSSSSSSSSESSSSESYSYGVDEEGEGTSSVESYNDATAFDSTPHISSKIDQIMPMPNVSSPTSHPGQHTTRGFLCNSPPSNLRKRSPPMIRTISRASTEGQSLYNATNTSSFTVTGGGEIYADILPFARSSSYYPSRPVTHDSNTKEYKEVNSLNEKRASNIAMYKHIFVEDNYAEENKNTKYGGVPEHSSRIVLPAYRSLKSHEKKYTGFVKVPPHDYNKHALRQYGGGQDKAHFVRGRHGSLLKMK